MKSYLTQRGQEWRWFQASEVTFRLIWPWPLHWIYCQTMGSYRRGLVKIHRMVIHMYHRKGFCDQLQQVWPRPLTPKVNRFVSLPCEPLVQCASKSVHLFSKYRIHTFDNGWTDRLFENKMSLPATLARQRHKNKPLPSNKIVPIHPLLPPLVSICIVSLFCMVSPPQETFGHCCSRIPRTSWELHHDVITMMSVINIKYCDVAVERVSTGTVSC